MARHLVTMKSLVLECEELLNYWRTEHIDDITVHSILLFCHIKQRVYVAAGLDKVYK